MKIVRLSWEDIERACRIVARKMLRSNFTPDLCVAISRGGFPPARILCDLLSINNLASIKIENYSNIDELLVTPRLVYPLSADTKGKRVLIIDDVADRGDSLILARKHVVELGAREVRVATLHYKPWSKIKPDYYALEYRSWIVYPWEITETVRKLVLRLLEERKSMDEIKKRLLKLKITDTEISKYVRELGQN